jgi:hypothetical protein
MSNSTQEAAEMGTKPIKEHEWLNNLLGEWRTETEMVMEPGGKPMKTEGRESCKSLGGLWAFSEGDGKMPDGTPVKMYTSLGYDVSFKEYRGCWFGSMSSHLWKYVGELSADGKTMTLNCEGPDMEKDGETALYRDVIELVDKDHRTLTSYGQDKKTGEWQKFMTTEYTRI